MKLQDALNILGLARGTVTLKDCRDAYRRACAKYHPDRNPAGLEMMKAVNAAWAMLKDLDWTKETVSAQPSKDADYGESLNAAISAVIDLPGVELELCGAWLWLSGDTKPHKDAIKAAGFRWASKKKRWYFRPAEWKSSSRGQWSMEHIRARHGSAQVYRRPSKQQDEEQQQACLFR